MNKIDKKLVFVGAWVGLIAVIIYISILSLDLPDKIVEVFAISLGPMQIVSGLGIFYYLKKENETLFARLGLLFTIIGGVIFTLMVITQFSVQAFAHDYGIENPEAKAHILPAVYSLGNIIQLSFDVVFDTFVSLGTFFFGLALMYIRNFKWIGLSGMIISSGGLFLNIFTLPYPPAESGYFDPGPFYGIFILVICILILIFERKNKLQFKSNLSLDE